MYTLCPQCHHSQQISRKQLKKKRGQQLSCPECKQQFNATLTLSKKAPQASSEETQVTPPKKTQVLIQDAQIPELPALKKAKNASPEESETIDKPVIELYDWQKPPPPYRPDRWLMGLILGLGLLTYQVYYFKGYSLSQDPQIRPWLNSLKLPLAAYRKPLEFTTVGSSLQPSDKDHYRLQVSLVNHADFPQPPPYLQLTLQNFYGGIFSQRIFSPQEYLSKTEASTLIKDSATLDIDFLIAVPAEEIGGYSIELK
ncbi:MAG: DUF3426 domain-containing protein [Methyloprofundus sp.]|nr:DUF3426 domain-containing protein [Methyloprofundus sp.]